MRTTIRKSKYIVSLYYFYQMSANFILLRIFSLIKKSFWFIKSYIKYKGLYKRGNEDNYIFAPLMPSLNDNTSTTPLEPIYFYQDCWAARKIFSYKPKHHYDIGSSVKTIGIISQFVPVTMIDIRPIELKLENLFFKKGSILNLPYEDKSLDSVSSLCVIEHIGLGRYGDQLDVKGTEKAISELKRVVSYGGRLLISVPVDSENKIYFNSHRAFTRDYILAQFPEFELLDEKYIYGNVMYENYDKSKGFGTGLFFLSKLER